MMSSRWMGAALVMGWLGCGGQVDDSTGSTSTGGHAGAAGSAAGTGGAGGAAAGTGGTGVSGSSGYTSGGQGPGGAGVCWAEQAGAGQGGAGQGDAGQGGQGGEMLAGCDWYEQLMDKVRAKAPPCSLHGLRRIRPDGSTEPLSLTLPDGPTMPYQAKDNASPEEISWKRVWTIVAATDAYVFLTAWAPTNQRLLVAVSTKPGMPAVVIDDHVSGVATAYQADTPNEVPGQLYYTQNIPTQNISIWKLRHLSLTDPTFTPETVTEGDGSSYIASVVLRSGDEMFVSAFTNISRLRKGKTTQSLQVGGLTIADGASGFAVIGDRLLYNYSSGGGVLSDLNSVALTEEAMTQIGFQKVSGSGSLMPVRDGEGKLVVGMLAYGGLVTIPAPPPIPAMPVPISLVWKGPTYETPSLRLNHLEYGTSGEEPGYFIDVTCGLAPYRYAPAFVTTKGELKLRASEPGFPFVDPLPWANTPNYEDWKQHGSTQGIYAVFD